MRCITFYELFYSNDMYIVYVCVQPEIAQAFHVNRVKEIVGCEIEINYTSEEVSK